MTQSFTTPPPAGRFALVAALCIGLAATATYRGSLAVPFFFDDTSVVLENRSIRDLAAIRDVLSPPNTGSGVTGRPLVNLTLALNYAAGGTAVQGYHVFNLFLHIAS